MSPAPALRLLSWNVRDLLGDPLAVARVITSARPDVVCLQEAPRWPGSRWRLAALARACGLGVVGGGRSGAGTAILAALRAGAGPATELALPVSGRLTRPRGLVLADVGAAGGPRTTVASIHLGLTPEERARHVAIMLEVLRPRRGRLVVAGDLNEPPGGPSWEALGVLVADTDPHGPPTYPAASPVRRLDAVLVSEAVTVSAPGWLPDPVDVRLASDHLPVLRSVR